MVGKEEIDSYLAKIRRTISESEAMVQRARLCMQETDRLLESQGLTREQVLALRITDEQRELVNAELKRRGFPELEHMDDPPGFPSDMQVDYDTPDTQGDLDNRQRRFGDMMNGMRL